jgi:hypothetical protein
MDQELLWRPRLAFSPQTIKDTGGHMRSKKSVRFSQRI